MGNRSSNPRFNQKTSNRELPAIKFRLPVYSPYDEILSYKDVRRDINMAYIHSIVERWDFIETKFLDHRMSDHQKKLAFKGPFGTSLEDVSVIIASLWMNGNRVLLRPIMKKRDTGHSYH